MTGLMPSHELRISNLVLSFSDRSQIVGTVRAKNTAKTHPKILPKSDRAKYIYKTSRVVLLRTFILSLQKKFVEKLATHDNSLVNDIYNSNKDISPSGTTYLSPVGVLCDDIDSEVDPFAIHVFYIHISKNT